MASNIRSDLSETTFGKSSPRVASLPPLVTKSRPTTPSPAQHPRFLFGRSSPISNPSTVKRSLNVPSPPERTRLIQIKEDLRIASELIEFLQNEKAKTLFELREAREEAEEASVKLVQALEAKKQAEERFEIEKFEAVEAGIDAVQRKEEELTKELEIVKQQHASDSASLFLVSRELEKVNQELAATNDAKSKILSKAEDANKMAAIHAEKVEILSSELKRLKSLIDSTREKETISKNENTSKLVAEVMVLKAEVKEQNVIIEKLNVILDDFKMAKSFANYTVVKLQDRAEELERQLGKVKKLEITASVSLASVTKQLQEKNDMLQNMEFEMTDRKEKIRLLETTVARQKKDLEKSEQRVEIAEEEVSMISKEARKLNNNLDTLNEEKNQSLKKEQEATLAVKRLLEENNKILSELESSKEEEEKNKKSIESLALALQEVSSEARQLKEKLLSKGFQDYETEIEDLKLVIKETNDKYETKLEEAKHENHVLVSEMEQIKKQFESSMVDWEMKEAGLVNHVKKFDEEVSTMGKEITRLSNLLKRKKDEGDAAWDREIDMRENQKELEDEVIYFQETLREAKHESLKLKEKMLDKETEFQSVINENDELRMKQDDSMKKINELSKLLEEALAKKHMEENGELSESEKDYDLLPKMVEFYEENGHRSAEEKTSKVEILHMVDIKKEDSGEGDDEFEMWESCQFEKKDGFHKEKPEHEEEEEDESKKNMEETWNGFGGEGEMVKEKKKTTLLGKVGNLLKKKGSIIHK